MEDDKNLRRRAISSSIWKFMERVIAQGITLLVSIVLARLLTPADYGVVSIVTIFFNFANVIIAGGLNTALIQKKNADAKDYSTVFTVSIAVAFFLYGLLFFTAPLISAFYKMPELRLILRVMGIALPVYAVKSIYCAYISAILQFKKFFYATIIGTLLSGIIGISMAINGFGAWALVAQQLSNSIIDTLILVFVTKIQLSFTVSANRFRGLFSYGYKILISNIIGMVYTQLNPLFISVKYSSADLSYYSKGQLYPGAVSATITNTLSAVLFPVLALKQESKKDLLHYTRVFMKTSSYIVFPLMLGFFAISDTFVNVIFTSKWMNMSYYMKVFCICSIFDIVAVGNCETIKAMGKSNVYLKIEIIKKTLYFLTLALFLLITKSPQGLALSAIACTLIQIVVNSAPNIKLLGYTVKEQLADLIPNLVISVLMSYVVYEMCTLNMNQTLLLLLQILTGAFLYILLSIVTKNPNFYYIKKTLKDLGGSRTK